ncbi:hypothetical protein BO94DRAFT_475954 [Aspergillus sclerotioniger CBS 115572]|uniref:TPR-like protein n=1 Tax=Aspergillus sclerotioniger CBS 115572 TaxID=1450535 RepID=A0A317VGC7_9EURO|nr:hypothetical protein BO94DRAFT_475954 [Aspergillus sclerotioniger CBS 115572]PWY72187.1 hypothetical protein BO94DRAFT_475954 [Aspergillus sclerotioniger CBS 115572]
MLVNKRGISPRRDTALNIRADSDDEYTHLDQNANEDEAWPYIMEANYNKGDLHIQYSTDQGDFQNHLLPSEDGSGDDEQDGSWPSNFTDDDNYSQNLEDLPSSTPKQFQTHFRDTIKAGKLGAGLKDVGRAESLEPFLAYFDGKMDKRQITSTLFQVGQYLRDNRPNEAESYVQKALNLADKLGERPLIARCQYWQGRVKYAQGHYDEAHQWFSECQLWITEYPEANTMAHYMQVCKPELSEEQRRHICQETRKHGRRARTESTVSVTLATQNSKQSWEDSLHLLSAENIPKSVHRRKMATPKSHLDRLPRDTGGFMLSGRQKLFSFEIYPIGMASRYRSTKLFPEQPYEIIVPQYRWDDFIEHHKDKSVTMSYLEREQRRYQTKRQEKIYRKR